MSRGCEGGRAHWVQGSDRSPFWPEDSKREDRNKNGTRNLQGTADCDGISDFMPSGMENH